MGTNKSKDEGNFFGFPVVRINIPPELRGVKVIKKWRLDELMILRPERSLLDIAKRVAAVEDFFDSKIGAINSGVVGDLSKVTITINKDKLETKISNELKLNMNRNTEVKDTVMVIGFGLTSVAIKRRVGPASDTILFYSLFVGEKIEYFRHKSLSRIAGSVRTTINQIMLKKPVPFINLELFALAIKEGKIALEKSQ